MVLMAENGRVGGCIARPEEAQTAFTEESKCID